MKSYLVFGFFYGVDDFHEFIIPERFFLTVIEETGPNQARHEAEEWLKRKIISFYGRYSNLLDCEAFADEMPVSLSDENVRKLEGYEGISKDFSEWWEFIQEHLSDENLERLSQINDLMLSVLSWNELSKRKGGKCAKAG